MVGAVLFKRIIGVVLVRQGFVVQSLGFKRFLPVGRVEVAVEFFSRWGLDEIILLDIDASLAGRAPDQELVRRASRKCFVPLTVGGGIRSLDHMNALIHGGADKIAVNTAALEDPGLINRASAVLGDQCVLVSMDVRRGDTGYEVFSHGGQRPTGLHPVVWARDAASRGAGEILVNAIDRDGCKRGFDLELMALVADAVRIPVIACGGAGHPDHFAAIARDTGVSAIAAGNYFHFTEHSPMVTKAYLAQAGIPVRLDTYARYTEQAFDVTGRAAKKDDGILEKMRFEIIPDEII